MPTALSLFSGAGGLDLGFEAAGFDLIRAVERDPWCVATLRRNRPTWAVDEADVREWDPPRGAKPDVLLAGVPCQGFSLGGRRDPSDSRNSLYLEVVRIAEATRPKVIVIENVLNLGTMEASSGRTWADEIEAAIAGCGYSVDKRLYRMSDHMVPQTRRRFAFVAFRGNRIPSAWTPPSRTGPTCARAFLEELGAGRVERLIDHDPAWGFGSAVHEETGLSFDPAEAPVPVRLSRTASDGNPIRSLDVPFPAVDTGTIWGWAQGGVRAERREKDRRGAKFVRNPDSKVRLWRVTASRIRRFTLREYARLQTFPDDWAFEGRSFRDKQLQVGNAVPVAFATELGLSVLHVLRRPVRAC